jgi:NAD(P)-dependent dehydrogenase (short-subunit alcohol dehydrogenase family)
VLGGSSNAGPTAQSCTPRSIQLTCSSAIAEGFSSNGAKVFITGRRADVLEKAAKELNETATLGGEVIPCVRPFCTRSRVGLGARADNRCRIQGDVGTKDGCAKLVKDIGAKVDRVSDSTGPTTFSTRWCVFELTDGRSTFSSTTLVSRGRLITLLGTTTMVRRLVLPVAMVC